MSMHITYLTGKKNRGSVDFEVHLEKNKLGNEEIAFKTMSLNAYQPIK